MSSNKKFVTTIFDIFGYSLIGIIAYVFGLILQNHNSGNALITELISYGELASSIILLICLQIVYTCLFGFSYATVFFNKAELNKETGDKESHRNIFNVTGNWIEVILICFVTAVFVFWIINPSSIKLSFWYVMICSGIPYIVSSMVYRVKSKDISSEKAKWLKEAKYVLVCPAVLMIGVNIYLGSTILNLLNGDIVYFYPILLFSLFFIAFYISLSTKADVFLYVFFTIIFIIVGGTSYNTYLSMASKNMFLSIMASIFLAIFECWYIAFRQLKDTKNKSFVKVASYIVIATPSVVFSLFSIQDFKIIYFFSFLIGMLLTQFIWFFYIYPKAITPSDDQKTNKKHQTYSGFLRAGFGIITLICLTLDKHLGGAITPSQIRNNTNASIDYNAFWVTFAALLPLIIAIIPWLLNKSRIKNQESLRARFKKADVLILFYTRLGLYIIPAIALAVENRFIHEFDVFKQDITFFGLLLFILIDTITTLYLFNKELESKTENIEQQVKISSINMEKEGKDI